MRNCRFNGCGEIVPDDLFACKRHWYSLSPAERARIHAAYADYLEDKIGMERLRQVQQGVLGDRGTA